MATINTFEEMEAWKEARLLVSAIYKVTRIGTFSKDFGLRDQIRRAAVSVLSNIAEGFERGSRAEFHRFLLIAKGSAGEVRAQLYVALDEGYLSQEVFLDLKEHAEKTSRLISGFTRYLSTLRPSEKRRTTGSAASQNL